MQAGHRGGGEGCSSCQRSHSSAAANQSTFLSLSFSSFSVFDYVLKHAGAAPIKKEMPSSRGLQFAGMLRFEREKTEESNAALLYQERPLALYLSFRG